MSEKLSSTGTSIVFVSLTAPPLATTVSYNKSLVGSTSMESNLLSISSLV